MYDENIYFDISKIPKTKDPAMRMSYDTAGSSRGEGGTRSIIPLEKGLYTVSLMIRCTYLYIISIYLNYLQLYYNNNMIVYIIYFKKIARAWTAEIVAYDYIFFFLLFLQL